MCEPRLPWLLLIASMGTSSLSESAVAPPASRGSANDVAATNALNGAAAVDVSATNALNGAAADVKVEETPDVSEAAAVGGGMSWGTQCVMAKKKTRRE